MRLDPHTTVASLLAAIPSSALAFKRLGIVARGNESRSLQQVCTAGGVSMEEFLRVMNEIDWSRESPLEDPDRPGTGR